MRRETTAYILLLIGIYCVSLIILFGLFEHSVAKKSKDGIVLQNKIQPKMAPQELDGSDVEFIKTRILSNADMYAGAWWQSIDRFLDKQKVQDIFVEEGVFWSAYQKREKEVRMTVDFMNFAVEHMSKWWKVVEFDRPGNQQAYRFLIETFLSYIKRSVNENKPIPKSAMQNTIALVVFSPWRTKVSRTWSYSLSACSLAATISSLINAGCGRIVVTTDVRFLQSATVIMKGVSLLLKQELQIERESLEMYFSNHTTISHAKTELQVLVKTSEITFRPVNCTQEESILRNRPIIAKAGLLSLRRALLEERSTKKRQRSASRWLGSHHEARHWKFFYLTEADTILKSMPNALPVLSREVEEGNIVIPHRLQPIPSENDLPGYNWPHKVVPSLGAFENVANVGPMDRCCDEEGLHPNRDSPHCNGTFWFLCGFPNVHDKHKSRQQLMQDHFRLSPYGLMRLEDGIGIASLVGNQNGRRCTLQSKHEPCRPRTQ